MPSAIRTDNGTPSATQALCGLSRLSVWWIKLGVDHQRIDPGQPQQNGTHERMHRTLRAECARPPEHDMAAQQQRSNGWRAELNDDRPHDALAGRVPADLYAPSPRPMPDVLPAPDYPGHFEVRYVSRDGAIRLRKRQVFVSQALGGETVGLEEVADGVWSVSFFDRLLARLDERTWKLSAQYAAVRSETRRPV